MDSHSINTHPSPQETHPMTTYQELPPNPSLLSSLTRFKINPLLGVILARRPIKTTTDISLNLSKLLPTSLLTNAKEAASVIIDYITANKKILILSDYDADGATSTAIVFTALKALGANVKYLIPHRTEHGYGLTLDIAQVACSPDYQSDLIITVDNGVSSHDGINYCNSHGSQVIVTDHHLCPPTLPNALLIVNPNQPSCSFPSKALAGCGVSYYVMIEVLNQWTSRFNCPPPFSPQDLLPIVAIGTICDVVPFDLNNRILVHNGLSLIRQEKTTEGIKALVHASGIPLKTFELLTSSHIAFGVGPRINAAGRLESMNLGVKALLETNPTEASNLASQLTEINTERKTVEADVLQHALLMLNACTAQLTSQTNLPYTLVYNDPDWHQGVVGIAAGRLKETYHRPTFIFNGPYTDSHGQLVLKGSGRAIPGFHLRDALDEVHRLCPQALLKYGGHAAAAGATVSAEHFNAFKIAFETVAKSKLTPDLLEKVVLTDGPFPDFKLATLDNVLLLAQYPWGQLFPPPLFTGTFEIVKQRLIGKDKNHLKLTLRDPETRRTFEAIRFKHDYLLDAPPSPSPHLTSLCYRIDLNHYVSPSSSNNPVSLQLLIEAFDDQS